MDISSPESKLQTSLMIDGRKAASGDVMTLAILFNNLSGANKSESEEKAADYLAYIGPALIQQELKGGEPIELLVKGKSIAKAVVNDPLAPRVTEAMCLEAA